MHYILQLEEDIKFKWKKKDMLNSPTFVQGYIIIRSKKNIIYWYI